MDDVLQSMQAQVDQSINHFKTELAKIRTGRASASILDNLRVTAYDSQMPVNQVATINIPESNCITIQPWDATVLPEIERAIMKSDLGLTPMNDGQMIRINIPPLTEERRKELLKQAKEVAEQVRVSMRQHRRDAISQLETQEKNKELSEDELHRGKDQVQAKTDAAIKQADEVLAHKEKDIMSIS